MGTYWADVSQFQPVSNDDYPHRVFCFRSNTGSVKDSRADANLTWALSALDRGRLDIVIVYYFFRPGAANCDLWREVVTRDGRIDPRIVCMVDVESGNGSSQGSIPNRDHSSEINDEINRVRGWLGGKRVIGYYNPKADPALWQNRGTIPLVVPHYGIQPGQSYAYPNRFAHQYSDRVVCAPFGPCDANYTDLSIDQLKALFGLTEGAPVASLNQAQANAVAEGGGQLLRYAGRIRLPSAWLRKILGHSWLDKEGPRYADAFAALVNEVVWDGYDFTSPINDVALLDIPDEQGKNLVTMVRQIGARQKQIEKKLDRILAALDTQEK
ncbi:lysin A, glycosyl hydrolase domain [Gordonia phage Getalong]|uniref:Lysin A, glycosyl hydrolase domain n=1 Tax=Gordonia phage Getalong TaxID=2315531 RepID=A0A386KFC1_9CAUD|nr:endolysin [Gordonia phage Getalong]AYD83884.1 lysin A, glycosyl hydrolase domain [Gordonia phage Getalong]